MPRALSHHPSKRGIRTESELEVTSRIIWSLGRLRFGSPLCQTDSASEAGDPGALGARICKALTLPKHFLHTWRLRAPGEGDLSRFGRESAVESQPKCRSSGPLPGGPLPPHPRLCRVGTCSEERRLLWPQRKQSYCSREDWRSGGFAVVEKRSGNVRARAQAKMGHLGKSR